MERPLIWYLSISFYSKKSQYNTMTIKLIPNWDEDGEKREEYGIQYPYIVFFTLSAIVCYNLRQVFYIWTP